MTARSFTVTPDIRGMDMRFWLGQSARKIRDLA